ncbi:MAG: hypothetical protein Q4F57_02665 [Weeksellaceae bacterium]|nr:hypothetical protein [Weeksellaceae bacterium]
MKANFTIFLAFCILSFVSAQDTIPSKKKSQHGTTTPSNIGSNEPIHYNEEYKRMFDLDTLFIYFNEKDHRICERSVSLPRKDDKTNMEDTIVTKQFPVYQKIVVESDYKTRTTTYSKGDIRFIFCGRTIEFVYRHEQSEKIENVDWRKLEIFKTGPMWKIPFKLRNRTFIVEILDDNTANIYHVVRTYPPSRGLRIFSW